MRERAIALRREGKSRREIKAILGPMSNSTLNGFLQGVPPPDWTRRPNAKDELRDKARGLRNLGLDYNEIAASLGVSKSSVSLWVRDFPTPPRLSYEEYRKRSAEGSRRYWEAERPAARGTPCGRAARAAAEIGDMTAREILIAGAIAYWCEGAKNKPHRRDRSVVFINSDPALIGFFLRFLDTAGIARETWYSACTYTRAADVEAAQRFWLDVTEAQPSQFAGLCSSATTRRPCVRTLARVTTAA